MSKLIPIIFVAILFQSCQAERILAVIQAASYSHQMFYHQLWRELAIKGHDIVVVTTDPTNETLPNFKEISVRECYGPMKEFMNIMVNTSAFRIILEDKWNDMFHANSKFFFKLPQIQALLHNKSEHFDLFIVEHFLTPTFAFQHRFNCPMIGVISLDGFKYSHEIMGNPINYILYPFALLPYQENMSLIQRIGAIVFGTLFDYMQSNSVPRLDELTQEIFGKDTPPLYDILEKTDMLFVNANPLFSAIRPHAPGTISLAGGIHIKPPKELPKHLKDFLDAATDGAIYFSLGSNVKSNELDKELLGTIMETLRQIPHKILWKFEDDSLPGKPDNVMITKWAPQQDVLRHKNIKMFITQGGVQSLEEALYSHVPVVVMPFFGDQQSNAEKVKVKGLGLVVDRHNLKVEDFKNAIITVFDDSIYRETVQRLATQIQDTPMTPLERAVWWIEYVLRHKGAQHLKGPRIPAYQYYYFDVLSVILIAVLVCIGLIYAVIKYSIKGLKCLFGKKFESKQKLKKK